MNDYKELVEKLRNAAGGDLGRKMCREAADAIEQLARDINVLTKERDAAVADLKSVLASECGLNQCRYCKYQEDDYQCHHDCIPYSEKWGWQWRGVHK